MKRKSLLKQKKKEKNDEDDSNKASKLVVDLKNAFNDTLKDINESLIKSKKGQDQDNNSTGNLKSMSSLIPDNNEDKLTKSKNGKVILVNSTAKLNLYEFS